MPLDSNALLKVLQVVSSSKRTLSIKWRTYCTHTHTTVQYYMMALARAKASDGWMKKKNVFEKNRRKMRLRKKEREKKKESGF